MAYMSLEVPKTMIPRIKIDYQSAALADLRQEEQHEVPLVSELLGHDTACCPAAEAHQPHDRADRAQG